MKPKEVKKQGPARMRQLKKKGVQIFLTESQMVRLKKLAAELRMPVATFVRRSTVSFLEGGLLSCRILQSGRYD